MAFAEFASGGIHPVMRAAYARRRPEVSFGQFPYERETVQMPAPLQASRRVGAGAPDMARQELMNEMIRMALQRRTPGVLDELYQGGDIPSYRPVDEMGSPWGMGTHPAQAYGLMELLRTRQQGFGLGRGTY